MSVYQRIALIEAYSAFTEFTNKLKTGVSQPNLVLNDEPSEDEDNSDYVAFLPFQFHLYNELPRLKFSHGHIN